MTLPGSLELAYIGDTVYDLYVRTKLVTEGGKVKTMHVKAVGQVCSREQSQALSRVAPLLSPEEADVVRRARNAHQSAPKNAQIAQYHMATALEALIGYLYLTGRIDRLDELMNEALVWP